MSRIPPPIHASNLTPRPLPFPITEAPSLTTRRAPLIPIPIPIPLPPQILVTTPPRMQPRAFSIPNALTIPLTLPPLIPLPITPRLTTASPSHLRRIIFTPPEQIRIEVFPPYIPIPARIPRRRALAQQERRAQFPGEVDRDRETAALELLFSRIQVRVSGSKSRVQERRDSIHGRRRRDGGVAYRRHAISLAPSSGS